MSVMIASPAPRTATPRCRRRAGSERPPPGAAAAPAITGPPAAETRRALVSGGEAEPGGRTLGEASSVAADTHVDPIRFGEHAHLDRPRGRVADGVQQPIPH